MNSLLRRAARHWGVQTGYTDAKGNKIATSENTLRALLELLSGNKITDESSLQALILSVKRQYVARGLRPVSVVPAARNWTVKLYLPKETDLRSLAAKVMFEDGTVANLRHYELVPERELKVEGVNYVRYGLNAEFALTVGYHKLQLQAGFLQLESSLFAVPLRNQTVKSRPRWGVFAPLHALDSRESWGMGGLTELYDARKIIKRKGGDFFGVLPLLPCDYDSSDVDPSPYSPLSRLFWNEIFLDVEALVSSHDKVGELIQAEPLKSQLENLRQQKLVDYKAVYDTKKSILKKLAVDFFESRQHLKADYLEFLKQTPWVENYAHFRSQGDPVEFAFHIYVQFQLDQELKRQKFASRNEIAGLYLDFPIGVSRQSFDSQFFASNFLMGATAGAPPDLMFSEGQDWGFSPLNPTRIREENYEYFIKSLRHHLKYADYLRFDHAMGFHRIYVIPKGCDAKSGGYIRFKREEFLAILQIESHRSGVQIIGEDLGTVPDEVRQGLLESGCYRMWVLPFEAGQKPKAAIKKAPLQSLSCLNTHDMIPFEGFLLGRDIEIFADLSIISIADKAKGIKERKQMLRAWLKDLQLKETSGLYVKIIELLAAARPQLLLINLEDIWQETEPQNVPGTWKEYPNWRRKLRYPIEEWSSNESIMQLFSQISQWRKVI